MKTTEPQPRWRWRRVLFIWIFAAFASVYAGLFTQNAFEIVALSHTSIDIVNPKESLPQTYAGPQVSIYGKDLSDVHPIDKEDSGVFEPVRPEHTCEPNDPLQFDFSFVTQASEDKAWIIEHVCDRWKGPVVVAISYDKARPNLMPILRKCSQITAVLVKINPDEPYPINAMRNIAIAHVTTSHFLITDMDFLPSACLYNRLMQMRTSHDHILSDAMNAIVVPALDMLDQNERCESGQMFCEIPRVFADLFLEGVPSHTKLKVSSFQPRFHVSTQLDNWLSQQELRKISCFDHTRYEPYLVLKNCPFLPRFNEGYTGYGKNKIQFVNHVHAAGWLFYVIPQSFLVHNPHPHSESRQAWDEGDQHRIRINSLFKQHRLDFLNAYGSPRTPLCGDAVMNN